MKERTIRVVVLAIVFVAALIFFSAILNRGEIDITVDMDAPTLPTVSFQVNGETINLLEGHKNEVSLFTMRNVVTPLDVAGTVNLKIQAYENDISEMTYTLYQNDGKTSLLEKSEEEIGKTIKIHLGDALGTHSEGFLRIRLKLKSDETVSYYTRVTRAEDAKFSECLAYVKSLHDNMLNRTDTDAVEAVLETKQQSNQSLQHVTIHSSLQHVTWNKLNPKVVGEVQYRVQETKEAYTAIQLRYHVACNGDDDICHVREYFKVRRVGEKCYLLAYDRTTEEKFDASKEVLSGKGIRLGMIPEDIPYQSNPEGTVVAFVQADELWCYSEAANEFSRVFGFDRDGEDVRNQIDEHDIRILSMNSEGDVTFAVYGYMNRGNHEGQSGAAIYFFDLSKNAVEEIAFVPSGRPYVEIEDKLGKLAYYNHETNLLYVVAQSQLHKIYLDTNEQQVVLDNLEEGQYISSSDGRYLAYKNAGKDSELVILNFASDSTRTVKVDNNEIVVPLGFLRDDFVYGVVKSEDVGKSLSGEDVLGMYKVEICDEQNNVLITYQEAGIYILGTQFDGNMIRLRCATKSNGIYHESGEDYISNNEENMSKITLQAYQSEDGRVLQRLFFENGLSNRDARILKPKHVLVQDNKTIEIEGNETNRRYVAYAIGEIVGVYEDAGEAIKAADEKSGVVVSNEQRYVWESDNQVAWYRNFEMPSFVMNSGESSLAASLRAVLRYEGSSVDVQAELATKSAYQVLDEFCGGEAVRIAGCSVSKLRYLVGRKTPLIALTGNNEAIVLVGYDAQTVTYIDPHSGSAHSVTFDKFDDMLNQSGHAFLAYVK